MPLARLLQRTWSRHMSLRRTNLPRRRLSCEPLENRTLFAVTAAADTYRMDADTVLDTERELVGLHSTWSYLEANTDPSLLDEDFETTWFRKDMPAAGYDGPAFRTGMGLFGYGEIVYQNPPATELNVPLDPNLGPVPKTAYFTRTFDFAGELSRVGGLVAHVLADDGAFFYLNGQNAARLNMETEEGLYGARASGNGNESDLVSASLGTTLISGVNYLAVSVHGRNFVDSDIGFDMRLRYWWRGENVLDNDTSDLAEPPEVVLSVVEAQGQAVGPGVEPLIVATEHGTLSMRRNGTFRYQPSAGFMGTDSFTYRASDGDGVSLPATVTIHVESDSSGPTCQELDINASGHVERGDLAALASLYGAIVTAGAEADFSGDGRIGLRDLVYVRDAMGQDCGARAQAVTRYVAAVDRAHSQTTRDQLRTTVRRTTLHRASDRPAIPPILTGHADSVSVRALRGRRAASA